MLLLPDIITIDGNVLSIQDPYILNGYIITDVDIHYHPTDIEQKIVIKNENNDCLSIGFNTLERVFYGKMHEFICRNGYDANVEGRRDILDWRLYNINDYYRDMQIQCNRILNNTSSSYINNLKADLRRQNRTYFEPPSMSTWSFNSDICSISPFDNSLINTSIDDFRTSLYSLLGNCSINTNSIAIVNSNKYIHQYNYKPEYIHHYMPDENPDTTLLLGAEIEVDCGGESEEHAKNVLEIICGSDQDNTDKALENKMYCTHDGSLKNGIEFDTMPCSLEYHKKEMKYQEMFKYLDQNGYRAHDTSTCGLHVHADRKYLGKTELVQQLTISKILYILEKFNDEICVIARRDNNYSKFVGKEEVNRSLDKLYGKYNNAGKKVALNLQHKESIEFRCFKGTLKYETFILTLEFVKDIIDYAKSINIEEIELIQWSDLMNTFSDELKVYYNNRFKKEKKKKEAVKEATTATANISWNVNSANLDNLVLSTNSIRGFNSGTIYIDEPITFNTESYIPFALQLSEPVQVERTTLEILKDSEKKLKKQIKHSNNFMEKKRLETELKSTQKDIKKEKKRLKNNNTN